VNDIEACIENLPDPRALEEWHTRLVGCQRRKPPQRALQPMHRDIRMISVRRGGLAPGQEAIGIAAVNDLHLMPTLGEGIGQPVHKDPVTTKVIRRIKRRQHTKTQ
jgi:hypothetical protein